jgi:tRNA(fMet)-specific endonuclease VapC
MLQLDAAAGTEFERLLTTKGLRRIGRADMLIAALTIANRATLVTRNIKDFGKVLRLQSVNWVD